MSVVTTRLSLIYQFRKASATAVFDFLSRTAVGAAVMFALKKPVARWSRPRAFGNSLADQAEDSRRGNTALPESPTIRLARWSR